MFVGDLNTKQQTVSETKPDYNHPELLLLCCQAHVLMNNLLKQAVMSSRNNALH